jgi:hypothetical protein
MQEKLFANEVVCDGVKSVFDFIEKGQRAATPRLIWNSSLPPFSGYSRRLRQAFLQKYNQVQFLDYSVNGFTKLL